MNKTLLTLILLIVITGLGGFLRFYKNTQNPPSLNGDEISMAYDAYSILKTGRDQYGKFMPITFQSVGDYKNPVPIYLMTLPIKFFGLNDFSVRLQNALVGTLMIPAFSFFLFKIFKERKVALIGAFFLAISPWHIFYSRIEYETLIASFFVLLGIWFFMKMSQGGHRWAILSAFFLILTMYTAPAPRLFIPVLIVTLLIFSVPKIKTYGRQMMIFIATCFVLILPLLYATLFQGAGTRLTMVLISNDIEFQRYILLKFFDSAGDLPLLFFFWLKRYLNYFQPDFLFTTGLNMTAPGSFGLGIFYLFELPFLIFGIFEFIKSKIPYKPIFIIWLVTGIIPDSITNNQLHSGRLLHITPVLVLITALGAISFFKWLFELKNYLKIFCTGFFSIIVVLVLTHAFLVFTVHYPRAKGESFDEGLREAVFYVHNHQDRYQEIIFDPRRGVEGPFIVSNPYLYVLFYTKYDPRTYQIEPKVFGKDEYFLKFNKYTFREINWGEDQNKKETLFIGSPWSLPEKDLKKEEILHKIYLTNGKLAFLIVSPKR